MVVSNDDTRMPAPAGMSFELFVQRGYSDLELASVTETLRHANEVAGEDRFTWRFASSEPGIVTGAGGTKVRAAPDVPDHGFSDWMIVVGNTGRDPEPWMKRMRAMRRIGKGVVVLSSSATEYITRIKCPDTTVTTHWRDHIVLQETAQTAHVTGNLSEKSNGIVTSAGAGSTAELVIGLLTEQLDPSELAEIGNRLLLPLIRKSTSQQPRAASDSACLFEERLSRAVQLMEDTIDDPLSIHELTREVSVSTRHLERKFQEAFNLSPGRFYKRLRVRRARVLVDETQLGLTEIAAATGFKSIGSMSKAFREEYGMSPTTVRRRYKSRVLAFPTGAERAN